MGGNRAHLRQRPQGVRVEGLVCRQIPGLHTQKIFVGTGDVVALTDLRRLDDGLFEGLLRLLRVAGQAHSYVGAEAIAEGRLIQDSSIALDDSVSLQILNPSQAGGWGQADAVGQLGVGNATVFCQFTQYFSIYCIHHRILLCFFVLIKQQSKHIRQNSKENVRMDIQALSGLAAFALVSSITPGPNNMMLMSSGANFGLRRTLPHLLGVALGFVAMVIITGAGLMQLFDAFPVSYQIMRVVSVVYLLYLAARIATAASPTSENRAGGKPFTFTQAAAFQWVNPKAWSMALAALTAYAPMQGTIGILLVAIVFGAINLPCVSAWAVLGQGLSRFLSQPRRIRAFNYTMALLLIGSLYPTLHP